MVFHEKSYVELNNLCKAKPKINFNSNKKSIHQTITKYAGWRLLAQRKQVKFFGKSYNEIDSNHRN